ncbi:MAG TPA: hypothetical protein DEA43_03500 [Candidatus Moranbacteria bacterium]|nr:hypothetical protein [Candidatus Moranbacteria bacterium]HBT45921.1 hypothetical protein [Candidatus Moranbacteria bacterium]
MKINIAMKNIKFLLSLTTVTMEAGVGNWMAMIEDIKKFKLTEIGLFPTVLEKDERYKLYAELKNTTVKNIPFVHLRAQDMSVEELDFLVENFNTKVFNIHMTADWPVVYDYSKYAKQIFIENCKTVPTEKELEKFGGLCIDFSHWENQVLLGNAEYDRLMKERIAKYSIGVCHLSVIKDEIFPNPFKPEILQHDSHKMDNLSEFDYLKKYAQYIPDITAIELENSIEEQLEIKNYLENIIK